MHPTQGKVVKYMLDDINWEKHLNELRAKIPVFSSQMLLINL